MNVEMDQNALVSAIGSALAEQGVAEEEIPGLTQAIAGKVGEQLNAQLGSAQERIAARLGSGGRCRRRYDEWLWQAGGGGNG